MLPALIATLPDDRDRLGLHPVQMTGMVGPDSWKLDSSNEPATVLDIDDGEGDAKTRLCVAYEGGSE